MSYKESQDAYDYQTPPGYFGAGVPQDKSDAALKVGQEKVRRYELIKRLLDTMPQFDDWWTGREQPEYMEDLNEYDCLIEDEVELIKKLNKSYIAPWAEAWADAIDEL